MQTLESTSSIPQELINIDRWVLHKNKIPYQINGMRADSTNPNTWTSYEEVMKHVHNFSGFGYVLTKDEPYTVIDLDDCIMNGQLKSEAKSLVDTFDSYTEYSQSGNGLHIFIKGKKPGTRSKNTQKGIEMYDNQRFIIMTGNHYEGTPLEINERQELLNHVYDSCFSSRPKNIKNTVANSGNTSLSDIDVITKAASSRSGDKFKQLYDGNWSNYGSQSEADQALCNMIAFYTQDTGQIDRIFSNSGLYREKWDRQDYKANTIQNAIDGLSATYQQPKAQDFQLHVKEKELEIPLPFINKNNELHFEKEKKTKDDVEVLQIYVSRQIPMVTKEFHNIEHPQVFYQLEWDSRIGRVKEVVPASTIQDATKLIELSSKGLSVNTNNRRELIKYFDSFIRINQHEIKLQKAVERLGYVNKHFIHPKTSSDIEIIALDEGEKQTMEAFQLKGTLEGWKNDIFDEIKDQPKALFMVLSSFASILLNDLKIDPFIVELTSSTSQGKTTMLNIASTVWGTTKLVNEWNTTHVALERKASFLNSFPLFMDDTRKANKELIKNIVYHFSGGRSKGRGTLEGTRKENTWSNILLSTGETKMTEIETAAGGVAARIISLSGQPLRNDYEMVTRLEKAIDYQQGVAGVEFQKIWEQEKSNLIEQFPKFKKLYRDMSQKNEALGRISQYYAVVHFAGSILKSRLNFNVDLEQLVELYKEMSITNKAIDKPMQFIEEILIDLDSDRKSILYSGGYEPQYETKAYYARDQLWLSIAYVNKFLGIESRLIRDEWLARGMTIASIRNGRKIDSKQIKIDGKAPKAIPLNMELVKELDFDFTKTISNHR